LSLVDRFDNAMKLLSCVISVPLCAMPNHDVAPDSASGTDILCFLYVPAFARILTSLTCLRLVPISGLFFVGSMDETPALNLKDANTIRRIVSNADGGSSHPSESSHLDCL